uniref:Uncharacterized protein n=1 Tax=Lepeophtheirus salmonis TaxID=72036 RepID=A0A0K2T8R7_LEPSM
MRVRYSGNLHNRRHQ